MYINFNQLFVITSTYGKRKVVKFLWEGRLLEINGWNVWSESGLLKDIYIISILQFITLNFTKKYFRSVSQKTIKWLGAQPESQPQQNLMNIS